MTELKPCPSIITVGFLDCIEKECPYYANNFGYEFCRSMKK